MPHRRSIVAWLTLAALVVGSAEASAQEAWTSEPQPEPGASPEPASDIPEITDEGDPAENPETPRERSPSAPAELEENGEQESREEEESPRRSWMPEIFGFLTFVAGVDNRNQGSIIDTTLTPNNDLGSEFSITVYSVPTALGVRLPPQTIRGGWQIDGQILAAFLFDTNLLLLDSFARVRTPSQKVAISLGRFTPGILSPLSPSTWNYPFGWGNLQTLFTGFRLQAEVGSFFVDGGVGINAPLANRSAIFDFESGAERYPFVNLRLGYRRAPSATRFRREVGTTISLSGGYGYERVGTDEDELVQRIQPGARLPIVEDLQTWTVGAEVVLPITSALVLTGESYLGKNSHIHTGAMFQTPRIDLDTGRHYALYSMGGWLELSLATDVADLAIIAGGERILGRFEETSLQMRDDVRATFKIATVVSFPLGEHLSVGLQADYFAADFEEDELGRTVNFSALAAARLSL